MDIDELKPVVAAAQGYLNEDEPYDELVLAVNRFAETVYEASAGGTLPAQALTAALSAGRAPDSLGFLKVEEAYFITPADLLDRCSNLERVGVIEA